MFEYVLETKKEAKILLEHLNNLMEIYEIVSLSDLKELLGVDGLITHADNFLGWTDSFEDLTITKIRSGYIVDLPRPAKLSW